MEYIDGPTLAERLDVRRPEPGEAFELALQIAAGLEAIHEQGIVHRDFKPGNVMLDARGVAKIVDFGIAKLVSSETTGHTGVIGTPEYMSPEQGSGAKVDVRSDVYSLGCVVYELFAERPPFRGETALATLYMHQKERPPLETARVPEPLVPVLARALAKDPKDRFPRVADFAEALRAARDAWGGASLPRPLTPVPRPLETTTIPPRRRKARLRSAAPWLGAAAAAALSLALALRYGGADRPAPTGRPSAEPVAASATPPPIAPPARAVAPRPESARGAPRPVPTPGAEARDVQPTARPRAQQAQPAAPATPRPAAAASPTPAAATDAEAGLLTILVIPAAEIEVDGASLGVATQRELRLPPGPHTVKILHPDYQPLQRKVHVRTGVTSTLVLDLAEKAIRK
jgi:serine/threonine-protein kinase